MTINEEMIRVLLGETPLKGAEAAMRCGVTMDVLVRWITRGKSASDGTRRKLEGYHAGRSWMTSVEALARFLAASPRLPTADGGESRRRSGRARLERAMQRL